MVKQIALSGKEISVRLCQGSYLNPPYESGNDRLVTQSILSIAFCQQKVRENEMLNLTSVAEMIYISKTFSKWLF